MTWQLLVVDDEPLNLEIIAEFFAGEDYQLTFAENGEIAWSALLAAEQGSKPIELVVLDRMMPVLDGLSLLKRVKADERFRHLPVVMQTAASAPEEVRQGIEAGAYYYLTKPYDPEALRAIVQAALEDIVEQRQAREASARHAEVFALLQRAEFSFRTLDEAHALAGALAGFCPDPAPVALGLTELLVNAVEHGNLGISYTEKRELRQNDQWENEIQRRLSLPEYANKIATISVERHPEFIVFKVEDQGKGFDWQHYLDFDPTRAFDPNGRGIAMARQVSFSKIVYRDRGNIVSATVQLAPTAVPPAPTSA